MKTCSCCYGQPVCEESIRSIAAIGAKNERAVIIKLLEIESAQYYKTSDFYKFCTRIIKLINEH